ncbi:MAG: four helix bundle protein [Bacteroidetes bacterium]|nr:four helix bundle protein [Bacteroidota bacterium]
MFPFEKLKVYVLIQDVNFSVLRYLVSNKMIDLFIKDQWKRASTSIALNLAEGTGRVGIKDKQKFFIIARSSTFECVAILQIIKRQYSMDGQIYRIIYDQYEEISKMLLGLIRSTRKTAGMN